MSNIFNDFDFILAGNLDYTPLYHYTKVIRLYNILKEDKLSASGHQCICFTRDSMFYSKPLLGIQNQACIKVNKDLLAYKYKFQTYKFKAIELNYDEQEERIYVDEIPNISKYITEITLFPTVINTEGYKNQYVLRRVFKGTYDEAEPDMTFKEIYDIISSFNIPTKIHKGKFDETVYI